MAVRLVLTLGPLPCEVLPRPHSFLLHVDCWCTGGILHSDEYLHILLGAVLNSLSSLLLVASSG